MTIKINCSLTRTAECTFEVEDRELDIMVAHGVDVTDEMAVADFYRDHAGKEIDGYWFLDLHRIYQDNEHTGYEPEVEEWFAEGEAPDSYWPEEKP